MKAMSPSAIAAAVSGVLVRPGAAHALRAVFTDTRAPAAGGLFVALAGEHHDGHRFLAQAASAGAAAVLVSDAGAADGLPDEVAVIAADDTLVALTRLAAHVRAEHPGRVVAITGSVGKTTVKDMIAAALSAGGRRVHKTPGNWNNHIGLPLTLLQTTGDEDVLVLELGMSAPGEIAALTRLADPDVALITNAAAAHLAFFESVDAIADAKTELFEALRPGAVAVANADDARILARAQRTRQAAGERLITFGHTAGAEVSIVSALQAADGLRVVVHITGHAVPVTVQLAALGQHNALNAAAALAAVVAQGPIPAPQAAADALSAGFRPAPHRLELRRTGAGAMVLDDCYNANPTSTRAALAALAGAAAADQPRGAVLGTMGELGDTAPTLHHGIGRAAAEHGVTTLFATGVHAEDVAAGARAAGVPTVHTAADVAALSGPIAAFASAGAWLLIKGSRSQRLERVLDLLDAQPLPRRDA